MIQGLQNKALPKQRAITNAVNQLKTKAPHIPCASMMKKLMEMYFIDYENEEAKIVSENMKNIFKTFGDMISGDEKLFFLRWNEWICEEGDHQAWIYWIVDVSGLCSLEMWQALSCLCKNA